MVFTDAWRSLLSSLRSATSSGGDGFFEAGDNRQFNVAAIVLGVELLDV